MTMRNLHDTFHVSLLEPYKETLIPPHRIPLPPPPLYIKDDHEYYKVETILDSKCLRNRWFYLVRYKGYSDSHNSWEPLSNIPAHALIKEFHRRNPEKPGPRSFLKPVVSELEVPSIR